MKYFPFLFFLSIIAFYGCQDATTDPNREPSLYPFETDIIQPLSVGNYWVYDYIIKDSVHSTLKVSITDSTTKTYNGNTVTVFTIQGENLDNPELNSSEGIFVVDNTTYHTQDLQLDTIVECRSCLAYRYIGEVTKEYMEEEYNFDGKDVIAIKSYMDKDKAEYPQYYVLGIGMVESQLSTFDEETQEINIMTTKLVDYNIN